MRVPIKLHSRSTQRRARCISVLVRNQYVRRVLSAVQKHAHDGFVVGPYLGDANGACCERNVAQRVDRGQAAAHGHCGCGFQEVAALLNVFGIHV